MGGAAGPQSLGNCWMLSRESQAPGKVTSDWSWTLHERPHWRWLGPWARGSTGRGPLRSAGVVLELCTPAWACLGRHEPGGIWHLKMDGLRCVHRLALSIDAGDMGRIHLA